MASPAVFNPEDTIKSQPKTNSFSCKKCVGDSLTSSFCCFPCCMNQYCNDFPIVSFSRYTISECENACDGMYGMDNVKCCCWVCTPFAFVLDIVLCPCVTGVYVNNRKKEGYGIPCYYKDPGTIKDPGVIKSQPL